MRIGSILLIAWLVIGAFAAYQRDYFEGGGNSCAELGTVLITVVAGPLNYVGLNPTVEECNVPQPSP